MDVSVEVHFAKQLASNQPNIREKALKKLGKWFQRISVSSESFNKDTFLKIWKGIFYYYWHCDKMLVQEDRADVISQFIHNFSSVEFSLLYIDTFFQTMAREWHGIDRYRLEKFMMLVRRMLQQSYQLLKTQKWNLKWIKLFLKVLKKALINPSLSSAPFGLKAHMCDIYMEELAKAGSDQLTPKLVRQFLVPYCQVLCFSDDPTFITSAKKDVFLYLINQDADAREFHEFPVLKFKAKAVQNMLLKFANLPGVSRKNLKVIHSIVKEYEDYQNGIGWAEKMLVDQNPKRKIRKQDIEKASLKLIEEDEEFKATKVGFKRKRREAEVIDL